MDSSPREQLQSNCADYRVLNLTNELEASAWLWGPLEDLFFTVVLPCIMLIGFVGNVSFLLAVIRVRDMQTITNAYLANVAFADFLFVVYSCAIYLSTYLLTPVRNDVPYRSNVGCICSFGMIYLTYFASLNLITFVTVERYFAVCRPFQHLMVSGKSRTIKFIIASWVIGIIFIALIIPRHAGYFTFCVNWPKQEEYLSFPKLIQFCDTIHPDVYILSEACQTGPFFIAMIINLYMYTRIITTLNNRPAAKSESSQHSDHADAQQKQTTRVRNQVARLLIINGTIFFLSQFPYRILSINNILQQAIGIGFLDRQQYGMFLVISRCLILINSCANPMVYVTTSEFYRKGFKMAFECKNKTLSTNSSHAKSMIASISSQRGDN
ncbi:thyrotropin-releasing hormone receptor-like [Amphiura filiformis]|uniref:thyrotropin-releasing hormone receptor-like n=1 Tax=Amphiura filiformis TaxID=82378 RepID=UPI003B216C98